MKKMALCGVALLFFTMDVGAQEGTDRSVADEGRDSARMVLEGLLSNAIHRYDQIVVGDDIYALPKTLIIDGEQRLAGQVMDRLEEGEQVQLQLSDESRDGYPVVRGIKTNP